jgi:hypothetical protein
MPEQQVSKLSLPVQCSRPRPHGDWVLRCVRDVFVCVHAHDIVFVRVHVFLYVVLNNVSVVKYWECCRQSGFFLSHTGLEHSHIQELYNNRFVRAPITVCSSTVGPPSGLGGGGFRAVAGGR